jgi:pseudaminic acid biosynthesis-associated methylase
MSVPESKRLVELWSGEFGDAYVERNSAADRGRGDFWLPFLDEHPVASVLEVGCNVGGNLRWVVERVPAEAVTGIDVNERALEVLRQRVPGVTALHSEAARLPFEDRAFELVFTMGVLIHQPEETLDAILRELERCSSRYVLCGEYFSEEDVEVPYRGQTGALFKRDYGARLQRACPSLRPVDRGHLDGEGWDDVTWWLFERG